MKADLPATIFVVDDDPAIRRALVGVSQVLGLPVIAFSTAAEFLAAYHPSQPGCLVLDIKMPDKSGLELQQLLLEKGIGLPVIMISGHATVRTAVEVMSKGAMTLLEKPFSLPELMAHLRRAIELDLGHRTEQTRKAETATQLSRLTSKEWEVLELIAGGRTNKEIAGRLQLSVRAVEDRRARLMKKLHVRSVAELVLLTARHRLVGPVRENP